MSKKRAAALRERMARAGVDAYAVTSADAHQSEYVPLYWRARAWLTGFTGSNGLAVVTAADAGLWTDGRYFIQAEEQLAGSGIRLFKMGEPGVLGPWEWLAQVLPEGGTVAFDGRTVSVGEYARLTEALAGKRIRFATRDDVVGELWTDRPALPTGEAFLHEARFCGLSASEKLAAAREKMGAADWYLTAALENVAWLLNIRGRDIPQTPVVYAYVLIGKREAFVFIDPAKLPAAVRDALTAQGYAPRPYGDVFAGLSALTGTVLYDPGQVNLRLADAIPAACVVKHAETDPVSLLKAVKSPTELANIRRAFIKDGVVWVKLLMYLSDWADAPDAPLFEADIDGLLAGWRAEQADYLEPSFDTIAAYGAHAASMHYSPEGRGVAVQPQGFLLVDTGAQYLDGTTDITRTVVMGPVTDEMRRDFTLVLKGHIALASAQFLSGATGEQLDALARGPLWAAGMNYRSGTGHGLGYCLGVHEGPHSISTRHNTVKLVPGMLVTDEPGVYKSGRHGIRTENVLAVAERFTNEDGAFLGFDMLSFCPIDLRAIDAALLTDAERRWLDAYHQDVYKKISPHLNDAERAWLERATRAYRKHLNG